MYTNQPLDQGTEEGLHLSADALESLSTIARWALFLSILGFIGVGFLILAGIIVGITLSFASELMSGMFPFPPALFSLFYIVLGVLYLFPMLYLYRFSTQMQRAIQQRTQDDLNRGLSNLKAHYKFIGILAIVLIVLYFIAILGIFVFGASVPSPGPSF